MNISLPLLIGALAGPPGLGVPPSNPARPRSAATLTEDDGEALTLPMLFELIRERSPRFKAEQARVEVARSRLKGATALPNPIFNFQVLHLLSGYNQNGFGTYTVYLQQPLFIAGQRGQRKRAAKAAIKAAQSSVDASFHELAAEGRQLYASLQARQRSRTILRAAIADLERLRELVAARHASGAESKYDVARITLEVAKWQARVAEANADIRDAAGQLGVLIGKPRWRPTARGELRQLGIDVDPDRLRPDVERSHPAIKAARDQIALAEQDVKVARRDAFPQPVVGFGMVGIDNFYSISALGGLVIPMPVFDWGQGPLARAKADARAERLERDAIVAGVEAELDRAGAVVKQRRAALVQFEGDVLSKTADLRQMAEDAYVTGQASILELIDAVAARYDLQMQHVELVEEVVHAEIEVLHVTGRVEESF